jgi:hypothetical protein
MGRMPRIALFTLLYAQLTFTNLVHAEPIAWSYSSTFTNATDPSIPYLHLGTVGSGVGGTFNVAAQLFGVPAVNVIGSQVTAVGGLGPHQHYNAAFEASPAPDRNFILTVNLTDTESGQQGSVVFTGFFLSERNFFSPFGMQYTSPSSDSVVVGNHRYDVRLPYAGLGADSFSAEVNVSPLVQTPEPSSILLAILGLGGAGLSIRSRRISCPSLA